MPTLINNELRDAVILGDHGKIIECLKAGANPFIAEEKGHSPFHIAIILNDSRVVDEIFKYSKMTFDLSQPHPTFVTPNTIAKYYSTINWLQIAVLRSSYAIAEKLKRYQMEHFAKPSIESILNNKFWYPVVDKEIYKKENRKIKKFQETTLGSLLFWTISNRSMSSAFDVRGPYRDQARAFISQWFGRPESLDLKISIDESCVFRLSFASNLRWAMENGLNKYETDHNGFNLTQTAELFRSACANIGTYRQYLEPFFLLEGIELLSTEERTNEIVHTAIFRNPCKAHPIKAKLIAEYEEMILTVIPKQVNTLGSVHHEQRIAKLETETAHLHTEVKVVKADVEDAHQKINQLTECQYNDAMVGFSPVYTVLFKKLHKTLESYIRQKGDASLKIYQTTTELQSEQVLQAVISGLSIAAGMAPVPYVQVIPAAIGQVINRQMQRIATGRNKAIFDLELSPHLMATFIAKRLVTAAMQTYGQDAISMATANQANINKQKMIDIEKVTDRLFSNVKSQLAKLSKQEFEDPKDVIDFLCSAAVDALQLSRTSTGSGKSQHSAAQLTAYTGSPTSTSTQASKMPLPRQAQAGCCTIM